MAGNLHYGRVVVKWGHSRYWNLSLIRLHPEVVAEEVERTRRGFWMRMARERTGLSQATVAKELGLSGASKGTLSAWESGAREPSPTMLAKMARLYGVPSWVLMEPDPTAYERIDERMTQPDMAVTRDGEVVAVVEAKAPAEGVEPVRRRAWWLRDLREKRGLSLGQIAQRVGVNSRTVERWEEGIGEPSIRQESALAELLDAPIRRPSRVAAREDGGQERRSA